MIGAKDNTAAVALDDRHQYLKSEVTNVKIMGSTNLCRICCYANLIRSSCELTTARASVKKSSGVLKLSRKALGTSQDVQIMDNSTSAQIEEILAQPAITSTSPLPPTHTRAIMLNRNSL